MTTKLFKSMNIIRSVSKANLNLFRYSAMVVVLLTLGVGNAWGFGHGGACTAKLEVKKGTGSGSVYAATTSSATSGSSSASADCGNSDSGTHTHNLYAFATPAAGYTFLGWTESSTSTAGADASNPKSVTITSNNHTTVTKTLYAHFVEKAQVNITFEAPSNGTYTIAVNGGSTETVSSANVVKNNVESVTLTATPASGYAFAGWYKLNSAGEFVEDLSIASPYDAAFTKSETIKMGARFVPTTLGKFILKGSSTQYYGLKMATIAAGGSGTIVPVADETLVDGSDLMPFDNGTYSIKAGATLLVPYSSANTVQTTPQIITTAATLSAYKTLVFTDGVNVECDGTICVGGQIMAGSGGSMSSYVSGPCGMINMANGGHIELNSGAKLYCWGFIKGQDMDQGNNTVGVGTITANSGAEVWENLGIGDWRGGTATSTIKNTRFFPFQSYFIQNIEVPLTIEYGAAEKNYIALNATGGPYNTSATTIGSSKALFLLKDANSAFRKWYDPTTDLTCFELSGTSQIDALAIKISALGFNIDVNSADFDLPINSSMHIILTNSSVTLSKPMVLQPGAVIEVKNDANITLSSNAYLYDKDNWGAYAGPSYYFHSYPNLTSHKNRGDGKSNALLDDAKVIVDGTVSVTGKLYSTAAGANVMGNGGGKIVFSTSLPTATTIPAFTGNGDAVSGGVAVNSANLCNEDESYTKAIASKTFLNIHGRWFNQTDGASAINADHTYNFTYIASGAVSGTGGTDVSPNTHNAVYAQDKTGLTAGMKWCNVAQDATCSNIYNATQALNETPASDIRYTYPSSSWLQLLKTETEGVYGGSDNSLYAVDGCAVNSLGSVDENCLYTINDVKKALVDGHFVALEKNTEDEAWHDVANPTNYYICFEGCNWHPATKYAGEEKAYIVEEGDYIWYNNDWLLVEREDPFFFDYNEQNVKRYYEYEDGAWVLASPRVRVVDAIETRDFYKLPEAITVASGKKNATITILKDISGINAEMTYTAKNTTCTLDLNGHTVNGACAKLLTINASGSTFTITDNSEGKTGRLENIFNQNATTYNVTVTAGTLNLNAGTIYAQNLHQYRYKKGASDNVTSMGTRAVQVAAAQRFNITGGRVEANGKYEVYGIVATGSAANQTVVDISGTGEVYAEGALNTYGIACGGKLNLKAGLVEAHLNSSWANSYNTEGSDTDKKAHTTCRAITMSAKANATASSCYYGTLTVTGGTIKASTDAILALSYTSNVYGVYMNINVAGLGNRNFASTSGTNAQQASSIGSIKNAEIIVDNKANYGYGISVYGHYNSYNNSNSVFKVENTTVDVKAYYYAYGIYACGDIDGTTGECYTGDVELTNCTVTAEATIADYAYATYVYAGQKTIYKDKQANYYGEYATAAKMTINSGTYTAKTKKSTAYAACTSTRAKTIYDPETSVEASRTLGEGKEAYPTLIIKDGTFTAEATTTTARAVSSGGNTTITGGTFNATATKYYAYGLYAVAGTLTASNITVNATAKGRVSSSDNNAYAYGVYADCGIISSGNQAWTGYTYASDVTLNNCTVNATATAYNNARGLFVDAKQALLTQANFDKQKTTSSWTDATYNAYLSVFPGDNTSRAIASKATVNGGTFTVTAKNATAYGAVSTKTVITNTQGAVASPEMTLNNATFIAKSMNSTSAYGVYSGGPTTIDGCTITATAGDPTIKNTASGVLNVDKVTKIKNSTITATSADAAYGLEGRAEINATHGYCWHGDFDLSEAGNTTITAEAKTSGKTAYTIYLLSAKKNIATGSAFDGDYATAANATINGGTYVAKFNTSGSAYVISLGAKQTQGSVVAQPEVEVQDGFFNGNTAEVGTAGVVGHMQLKGGYFAHNTNLATYAVAPKKVLTLRESHTLYPDYKYTINEGGTVTWKNGTTTLKTEMYENGETPAYSGATPTKDADASYTYTHKGWTPTIEAMANADKTYTATFNQTENKYSVKVEAGANGSVSPASVSEIGCETASGDITATPATGYSFSSWTLPTGITAANGYTANSNPIRVHATAAEKTITANFAAKKYTVTLDDQSATTAGQASVTATYNEAMPSIADNLPEKIGHEFGGYYSATNGGGTQYYNANGASAHIWDIDAASPTLYAKWTINQYTISFNSNGGSDVASITQNYNTPVTAPANPSKTGYTFNGWIPGVPSVMPAEDTECEAQWTPSTNTAYTVKHYKQKLDGTYASTPDDTDNLTGTTGASVTPDRKSYEGFDAPAGETVTILADGSRVVTYNYTRKSYTLTWVTDGDALTGIYTNGSTKFGAAIIAPNTPTKTGYTFANWNPTKAATMPAANTTYTATWTVNQYTLTVQANDPSMGTVTGGGEYDYNSVRTIKATPKAGFKFVQWNDGNENSERSVTIPAENVTYTATFDYDIANYTVKHWQQNLNNDEYTEVEADRQTLQGTTATATAAAAKTYTGFTAQSFSQGTIAGDGSTVVNIYYNRDTYTITWKDGDGNTIETDENVKFGATPTYNGTTPTKTATAQYTYSFNNTWSPAIVAVEGAATYTAQFGSTVNKYEITWVVKLNGETIDEKSEQVEYGQTPSYGDGPTYGPTVSHVFSFSGWTPTISEVKGDKTYYGSFNAAPRPYTITFVNDDNTTVLKSGEVNYGAMPTYEGTPVSTQNPSYEFVGWTPTLAEVSGETTYTATYRQVIADIEVNANQNETVAISASTNVTTVHVTGSLSVAEGKTLKTTTLVLEASPDGSGQISGDIDADEAYLDYNLGGSQSGLWYDIAVPWEVDATNGVYLVDGDQKQLKLNIDFYLIYYNGELRARQNDHTDECWQFVGRESTPDNLMHPGRLYMIYLPKAGVEKLRFKRNGHGPIVTPEIQVYEYNYKASIVNRGWNGIANPTIYKAYLNAGAYTIEVGSTTVQTANYGQKYNPVYNNYDAFNMDETKLNVSQPVFVQIDVPGEETSRIVEVTTSAYANPAPVRKALVHNAAYEVQISAGANYTDRIYLQTVEGKEDSYRIGLDLSKAGTSSKVAQMWVNRYDTKLCVNTTAPVGTTATYPLGISVPSDGTYEITSATEMQDGQEMYVTYNGRAIWNLAYGPYAATLTKGTHNEYGLKLVQKAPTITTGVETVSDERLEVSGVRKVLIDDQIYIIRDGAVYTINGQQVK